MNVLSHWFQILHEKTAGSDPTGSLWKPRLASCGPGVLACIVTALIAYGLHVIGQRLGLRRFFAWQSDELQLWKVQRILHLVGLGLVAVAVAGRRIGTWGNEALENLDGWLEARAQRVPCTLVVLMLACVVLLGGASFIRHYLFNSTGYDLALQSQVAWNTAHLRPFASTVEVSNYLGDHLQPYLGLLAIPYVLVPSPYLLLAVQTCVLASTAVPLFVLARRKLGSAGAGLVFALCGLFYPPLGFVNRFDFHFEVVAIPLLLAAYERLDAGDLRKSSWLLGAALLAKEEVGLVVAGFGLMAAVVHRKRAFGLGWILLGTAYSLVAVFVIIPAFRGGPSDTLDRYGWLGSTPVEVLAGLATAPAQVLEVILRERTSAPTVLQLCAPLAFLPLLGASVLIPALPALTYNYVAKSNYQATIYAHYMVVVIPFVLTSAVVGARRILNSSWSQRMAKMVRLWGPTSDGRFGLGLIVLMVPLATVAGWTYENPLTDVSRNSPVFARLPNDEAVREGLAQVVTTARLMTTNAYAPHLANRPHIRILMYNRLLEQGTEAVFLNLRDQRWEMSSEAYAGILESAAAQGFGVTFYKDGVVLLEQDKGDAERLGELRQDLLDRGEM